MENNLERPTLLPKASCAPLCEHTHTPHQCAHMPHIHNEDGHTRTHIQMHIGIKERTQRKMTHFNYYIEEGVDVFKTGLKLSV